MLYLVPTFPKPDTIAMLIKDFPTDASTIPFNPMQQTVMWISFAIFVISSVADILIITAMVKQRDIPIDTKFIISMTVADFLFSTMEIFIDVINGKDIARLIN